MIADSINKQISDALKSKDEVQLSTLRMLSSAFNYERIAKQHELSFDEEQVVVRKEAKKRQDAIDSLALALGKLTSASPEILQQRLDREKKELEILKKFLPQDLSEDDLVKLVDQAVGETGASDLKDMGRVIGVVMGKVKGRADGKKVADLVKSKLFI